MHRRDGSGVRAVRDCGRGRGAFGALAIACLAVAVATAHEVAAQDGCEFGDQGNDVLRQVSIPGGETILYVTRPHLVCDGGIQIWADSAVAYTATDLAHLIGSVRYEDPSRSLGAREARYFSNVGRLQAEGALRVQDRDQGSVIENGALVYLRRTSFRDEESMTVTVGRDAVRPRATVTAREDVRDTGPAGPDESEPPRVYVVEGDRIVSRGEDHLSSTGSVVLWFDSIQAYADTLEYEEALDHLELRGSARVDAPDYDLEGETIELATPVAGEREVRASRAAELTGEDFLLQAERIFLFARDDRLQRLVALSAPSGPEAGAPAIDAGVERAAGGLQGIENRGRSGRVPTAVATVPAEGRPRAFADEFEITADSLEILAPGEQLERLFAAGRARSVSTDRDSLTVASLPDVAQTDWLEGDTIVVTFASPATLDAEAVPVAPSLDAPAAPDTLAAPDAAVPPAPDTVPAGEAAQAVEEAAPDAGSSGTQIERIVAISSARSLYRLPPSDPAARPGVDAPAIHYVVGDRITIIMQDGEVDRMEVEGGTTGIHLEPLRPGSGP